MAQTHRDDQLPFPILIGDIGGTNARFSILIDESGERISFPNVVNKDFATIDEAIAEANRGPFGLAAFAFTNDLRTANLVGDALEAGMVGINSFAISVADAPFGGVKESGFGSEGGPEGLDSYMVVKAIHQA